MNTIVKLKFVLSVLLVCCLFLPLSQCSTYSKREAEKPTKVFVEKRYAFESAEKVESWLAAITLIAPFTVLLLTYKTKHKIKSSIAIVVLCLAAMYSIFIATVWSEKILIGGYLGYFSSIALMLLIFIELWLNFRLRREEKNA